MTDDSRIVHWCPGHPDGERVAGEKWVNGRYYCKEHAAFLFDDDAPTRKNIPIPPGESSSR